jgi:hypothetical protein
MKIINDVGDTRASQQQPGMIRQRQRRFKMLAYRFARIVRLIGTLIHFSPLPRRDRKESLACPVNDDSEPSLSTPFSPWLGAR